MTHQDGQSILSSDESGAETGAEMERKKESTTPKISTAWSESRRKLKNFTLSWYSVCMGTGIVSELLFIMPYRGPGQETAGVVFFIINLVLFTIFTIATIARYCLFPQIPLLLIRHPSESLYVGTVPMAWATIVNMGIYTGAHYGTGVITVCWIGWWVDVVMAISTCFLVTYLMISRHEHSDLRDTSSLWLLPIVSAPVASTSATIIIPYLSNYHAYVTLLVAYALWGFGIFLAFMILMLYLQRLIFHHLPPKQLIVSIWLPIGFLGQGVVSIINLGKEAQILFPKLGVSQDDFILADAGNVFYFAGILFGLILWGFGMWWLMIAIFAVLDHLRTGFPFSMGWYSFTFPFGSLAIGTMALGDSCNAPFFLILGEIMSWCVVVMYATVVAFTFRQAYRGTLFYAPCLNNAPESLRDKATVNPLDGVVAKATDENLTTENWELILNVCDKLAEALSKNCGSKVHREIASGAFTQSLMRLMTDRTIHTKVKARTGELIKLWADEFKHDPSLRIMSDTYRSLKAQGVSVDPPSRPQKREITDKDRRQEEEELQMALALSLTETKIHDGPQRNRRNEIDDGPNPYTVPATSSGYTLPTPSQSQQAQQFQQTPIAERTAATVSRVRGLYDFNASEAGELSFRRGDVITVIESAYKDWWRGSLHGVIGIFPTNYVENLPEPTPADLQREAEEEMKVFAEAKNVEKLLSILSSASPSDPSIAENDQLQNLYHSTISIRPKLVRLIEKYSQKKDDLILLNEKFLKARKDYDELMEASLSRYSAPRPQTTYPPRQPPSQRVVSGYQEVSRQDPYQRAQYTGSNPALAQQRPHEYRQLWQRLF
ncbi:hypothetical protein MRB53_039602 [Persea americana]|nr:hypothetical protein MRB53_039602 [Persea americana]